MIKLSIDLGLNFLTTFHSFQSTDLTHVLPNLSLSISETFGALINGIISNCKFYTVIACTQK